MRSAASEKPDDPIVAVSKALGHANIIGGFLIAVIAAVGGIFVWVSTINAAVHEIKIATPEWAAWRDRKDEVDTKLATIMDGQQKLLERMMDRVDRMEAK